MTTVYPNMSLTLPTRGSAGAGAWGDTDDANWAKVDAHDHSSGKGTPVTVAGININADLSFSSLYAPTNLQRASFANVTALSSNNRSLFVSSNELFWRSNAGVNVQLTSGSSLNVAAFAGGIGGDYVAVGAAAAFDDANDRYTWKQQGGVWARMASGEVRILETGTSETVYVGLAAPGALAASYTATWPLALPAAAQALTIDNTGAMAVGASYSLTANNSITVSGTGLYKHGTKTLSIQGSAFSAQTINYSAALGAIMAVAGLSTTAWASIHIPVGARILAVRMFILDSATGPTKLQASLISITNAGVSTTVASSAVSSGAGANQTLAVSPSATTVASSTGYAVQAAVTTGTAQVNVYGCEVDYDQP